MKHKLLLLTALLVGCSSAPKEATTLYLLSESNTAPTITNTKRSPLVVRPVELASYLSNQGIVYQTSDTQVIQAKHNQWAHDISEQITQRIIAELRAKQNQYWPIAVNNLLDQRNDDKLQLTLSKFNGSYQGQAEIAGEWLIIGTDGLIKHRAPIQINVPLQNDGYDALVEALSIGLVKLTDQIAQNM